MTVTDHAPGPADLAVTEFLDWTSPEVAEFVGRTVPDSATTPTELAVSLYYAVRDRVHYEIYGADLSREGLRASRTLRAGSGMCIHKSVLYAACLRSVGVPARLVLADVRNHLTSPHLLKLMNGDVFRFHCYTTVYLNDLWIKATPVFSRRLCQLYRLAQLEFDGRSDSVYHPFDLDGQRHMEFLRLHGEFADLPYDRIATELRLTYPAMFGPDMRVVSGSLVRDAATA